jgi:hypothetical protein
LKQHFRPTAGRGRTWSHAIECMLVVCATTLVAGCGLSGQHPASDSARQSATAIPAAVRDSFWRADIRFFATELPTKDSSVFAHVTRPAFTAAVAALESAVPRLTDTQVRLRLARLAAMIGDGHTSIALPGYPQRLPISIFWSDSAPYVTSTIPLYISLLGHPILKVNGHSIKEVTDSIRPYMTYATEGEFRTRAWSLLLAPGALRDLGLTTDTTRIVLEMGIGNLRTQRIVASVATSDYSAAPNGVTQPLYRQRPRDKYWFVYVPETKTVYVKYNECRDPEDFRKMTDSVAALLDTKHPAHVVIDLRNNPGGDSTVIAPLIAALRTRPAINSPTVLYVVIGRATLSSGLAAAVDFRKETHATIIGEPAGERPNEVAEMQTFLLPASQLQVSYPARVLHLMDGNAGLFTPDVSVPPTPESIVSGRDPVMDWILARHAAPGTAPGRG